MGVKVTKAADEDQGASELPETTTMQAKHQAVLKEPAAKTRGERGRQLRRFGARDLTRLYNYKFDTDKGANLTQKMKIQAILDKEFAVKRKKPEDLESEGGDDVVVTGVDV